MPDDGVSKVLEEVKELTLPKASPREKHTAIWAIPTVTALLVISGFLIYYFVYVTSQREYLANRNFRALAVLGDQIQAAVSAHGSILEIYADLARETQQGKGPKGRFAQFLNSQQEDKEKDSKSKIEESRLDYLRFLAPGFELYKNDAREHPRPRFEVQRHNGNWQLFLTAERHETAGKASRERRLDYSGALRLDAMMQPLDATLPFDDILLVSEKGDVIYQQKKAGPQFTTLSALLQAQPDGAVLKPETAKPEAAKTEPQKAEGETGKTIAHNLDAAWRSRSMHLTDVTLAGTHYKLFLQPVLVDAFSDDSDQNEPAREWVLCGLRSAPELEWEALSISYTAIIWSTFLFFVVAVSGPILKVLFMNRKERFRVQEVAALGIFLILLAVVLTFSGLQAIGSPFDDDTETGLQSVQERLSGTLHDELGEMRQQLVDWCRSKEFHDDATARSEGIVVRNIPPEGAESGAPGHPPEFHHYPYTGSAFWTDDEGQQIIKWSTGRYATPMIGMSGQQIATHPKETYLDGKGPAFHFGSVLPPNKLDYLAVLTIKTSDCMKGSPLPAEKMSAEITQGAAFLSAQPLSLIDPILPAGYGFAMADEKGNVLFHSDKTRNQHENFQQESDWNRSLYAASFGHAGMGSLAIRYKGQDYRARVSAITGVSQAPWTLIIYRDLMPLRTLNLQAITMATTLLLIFLGGPLLWTIVWWFVHRPRHAPEWMWPNAARSHTYGWHIVLYALLAVIFLAAGFTGSPQQSIIASGLLPYAILLAVALPIRFMKPSKDRKPGWAVPAALPALAAGSALTAALLYRFRHHLPGLLSGGAVLAAATFFKQPRHLLISRFTDRRSSTRTRTAALAADSPQSAATGRRRYITCLLLIIFLAGVLLPLALFRASLETERRLQLKQAQLHLAAAVDARLLRITSACNEHDLNEVACKNLLYPDQKASAWSRIVFDPLFPRNGLFQAEKHSASGEAGTELYASWFQTLIYHLHHDYNQSAAETLGVIADRAGSPKRHAGYDWSWDDVGQKVTLRWHGVHLPPGPVQSEEWDLLLASEVPGARPWDFLAAAGVALGVMLLMGSLLWSLAGRIFLFHVSALKLPPAQRAAEAIREGRNVLILLPPASDWRVDGPKWTLDIAEAARKPEMVDPDAIPPDCLIELWHFEYTDRDQSVDARKYTLLRSLLKRPGTQVAVVMKVPMSTEDYRLAVPELEAFDLRDEPLFWRAQYEGRAGEMLWKECRDVPGLWAMGAELAKELDMDDVHSKDAVAAELLERADPYYKIIWKECTADQRFVLAQLAADGIPNPANARTLRQLVRRGLILTRPQFRVVNESFRRFLCSAPTAAERREWRREARTSGWGKVHVAFFITLAAAGAFLITTQNSLWDSAAAYVTTALGTLGTFTKLFNTYRGSATATPPNKTG